MGKESKRSLNVDVSVNEGEVNVTISEEVKQKIPRPGDMMYIIKPYPVDDEDETESGKIKDDAILAYSYSKNMVRASVLDDDNESVLVNGDFRFPLNEDMTLQTKKLMVFTKEQDAVDKYRSLMNSSIKEVERRQRELQELQDKYDNSKNYLSKALENVHH